VEKKNSDGKISEFEGISGILVTENNQPEQQEKF